MSLTLLLIALQAGTPLPPPAPLRGHICPPIRVTAHDPIPLPSTYEIIGLSPDRKRTYHGNLSVKLVGNSYRLTSTVGGKKQIGMAWMERCGVEAAPFVHAIFPGKVNYELRCNYGADFDNYVRLTCVTRRGANWQGRESWYELSTYAP